MTSEINDNANATFAHFTNNAKNQTLCLMNNMPNPDSINFSEMLVMAKCAGESSFKMITASLMFRQAICRFKSKSSENAPLLSSCQFALSDLLCEKIITKHNDILIKYYDGIIHDFYNVLDILYNRQSADLSEDDFNDFGIATAALKCKKYDDDNKIMTVVNDQVIDFALLPIMLFVTSSLPFLVYSQNDLKQFLGEMKDNGDDYILNMLPSQTDFIVNHNYDFQPLCRILSQFNNSILISAMNNTLALTELLYREYKIDVPNAQQCTSVPEIQTRIDLVTEFIFVMLDKNMSRHEISSFIAESLTRTFDGAINIILNQKRRHKNKSVVVNGQIGTAMKAVMERVQQLAL